VSELKNKYVIILPIGFKNSRVFDKNAEENNKRLGGAELTPLDIGKQFSFIDLFAGIGGIRRAFESAGGRCVFSSEWDSYAQKTYEANYGDVPNGDITQVDARCIPHHDILTAGFPCQPFSIAGVSKKNSLGRQHGFLDETQGTLFFDVARIIQVKRPHAFLLENVKNLKSHDKGRTFEVIKKTLDELDYEVETAVLDARHYVPQHRERIFIVGFDRRRYGDALLWSPFQFPKPQTDLSSGIVGYDWNGKFRINTR